MFRFDLFKNQKPTSTSAPKSRLERSSVARIQEGALLRVALVVCIGRLRLTLRSQDWGKPGRIKWSSETTGKRKGEHQRPLRITYIQTYIKTPKERPKKLREATIIVFHLERNLDLLWAAPKIRGKQEQTPHWLNPHPFSHLREPHAIAAIQLRGDLSSSCARIRPWVKRRNLLVPQSDGLDSAWISAWNQSVSPGQNLKISH